MRRSVNVTQLSNTFNRGNSSFIGRTSFALQKRYLTNLSGRWTNELGSKVELEFHKDGRVSGKYHTAVGDDHTWEPVHGSFAKDPIEGAYAIGFVVNWTKVQPGEPTSVTAWSGKVLQPENKPVIQATWILTEMNSPAWANTLVGQNTFAFTREGHKHHKEQEVK